MRIIPACWLIVLFLAIAVSGGQSGRIGSALSDIYDAYAPLGVLHRSYADFLFYGTQVSIPDDLASACEETGYLLGVLHIDLLTQTGSQVADTLPRLARLRADLAVFCDVHSETLVGISLLSVPDQDVLKGASDAGLFSDIYALQNGLQFTFEAYLEGLEDEQQKWEFAVAFALRTVLEQPDLGSVDPSLRDILYGSEEAVLPPAFVPQDVATTITQLVELIEIPLEESMVDRIRTLAQVIYDFVAEGT